ncbi:NnrU family protein [Massilia horti]|uniref:NnrU family protein n=1 Tax=Massilia horti TaxID=2562153 RepID=A0A4Y9T603_9BURK|nr:NnrU family protein [Massilia horti]TFW33555.1 NnrU family protein [Massilia horti]
MEILILGLVLFLVPHFVPVFNRLHLGLKQSVGEKPFKLAFSLLSVLGLVLIVVGYARAPAQPQLFAPSALAIRFAPLVMLVSFVLLAAANMRTRIRLAVRHPMLIGVILWSLVHLLANGSARATVLFGAFLAWALIDLVSSIRRHAVKQFVPSGRQDLGALVAGIVLALIVMAFHRQLFGVAVVPWGR